MRAVALWVALALAGAGCVTARAPYRPTPGWISKERLVGTGLALVDLNGDGWEDLIVSNGNDQAREPILVYFNDGKGAFDQPPWESDEKAFFMSLAVGDINGDGLPDLAVSANELKPNGVPVGEVRIFLNHGGALSKRADYSVGAGASTLACALGDVDGDGDLDLAMTTLADGAGAPTHQYIFYNVNHALTSENPWRSEDTATAIGVQFADLNGDGLLDLLVGAGVAASSRVYYASLQPDGSIQLDTQAGWSILNPTLTAMSVDSGPLGQAGLSVVLPNNSWNCTGNGCRPARPAAYPITHGLPWVARTIQIGSGAILADVDGDGLLDLITATWDGSGKMPGKAPVRIFRGTPEALGDTPWFSSRALGVGVTVGVAELRHLGLRRDSELFAISRPQAIVTLARQVISGEPEVLRNGQPLPPGAYARLPGRNWISFAQRLLPGERVEVRYSSPVSVDIAVANSDRAGTFIFYHDR